MLPCQRWNAAWTISCYGRNAAPAVRSMLDLEAMVERCGRVYRDALKFGMAVCYESPTVLIWVLLE